MSSQVLYRKWRPQTLADIVGQKPVTQTLLNALATGRISHAYLFCGPRGTGKTSTGRILAKAVNCITNGKGEPCNTCSMCQAITDGRALDAIEIDAASNTGVDNIRDLRDRVNYVPNEARFKVYIIDEFHMLSTSASNALLKTLEEPPPHVIFILATTEVHKILPTILSRCQRFDFRRLSQVDITSKLVSICSSESINIEPEALKLVAKSATGSLRDAENLLEQLITFYSNDIKLKQVQSVLGITGDLRTRELAKHIINNDITTGITTINSAHNDGIDLRQFNRELIEYLRELLLMKTGSEDSVDMTTDDISDLKELANRASLQQILKAIKLFGQINIGFDNYSTLPLELALVDSILDNTAEKPRVVENYIEEPAKVKEAAEPVNTKAKPKKEPVPVETPAEPVENTAIPDNNSENEPEEITEQPIGNTDTEPESPAIGTPAPGTDDDAGRLKREWDQVISQAPPNTRRSPALALLRSSGVIPLSVKNGEIILSFKHAFHKEKMEILENQKVAEKVISNFLGYECHIHCVSESNHLIKEALKMGAQIIDVEEK